MDVDIQKFIIKGLLENKAFFRKVVNNLEPNYFSEEFEPIVKSIRKYHTKYDKIPEYSVITTIVSHADFSKSLIEKINSSLMDARNLEFTSDDEWLFDSTRQFINERAIFKVLQDGAMELNKEDNKRDFGDIYTKMQKAVSIDWDDDLGYEYSDMLEFDSRYDRLCDSTRRIPTGITKLDEAINGGMLGDTKFLAVFAGSAGLGKCVVSTSTIKVRNKKTGEIREIPIGDYHKGIRKHL